MNETSAAVLATIGVMGAGMGLVFRALLASHASTIKVLTDQNQALQDRLDRALNISEGQNEVVKEVVRKVRPGSR